MCGACGRTARRDEWSGVFASRRARWEAALLVNAMLADGGHRGHVTPAAGGWLVQSGTGKAFVAETVSELWEALASVGSLPMSAGPAVEQLSPVAAGLADSAAKRGCAHDH